MGIFFLHYLSDIGFIKSGCSVIEIGCGTGLCGLIGCRNLKLERLTLTDGNESSIEIVRKNTLHIYPDNAPNSRPGHIESQVLWWGDFKRIVTLKEDLPSDVETARQSVADLRAYDIVIGFELIYYRTDLNTLVDTVVQLTNNCCSSRMQNQTKASAGDDDSIIDGENEQGQGLFIHAHIFRDPHLGNQLVKLLWERYQWRTVEVPYTCILSEQQAEQHPDWLQTRCLISGHADLVDKLKLAHNASQQLQQKHQQQQKENPVINSSIENAYRNCGDCGNCGSMWVDFQEEAPDWSFSNANTAAADADPDPDASTDEADGSNYSTLSWMYV